MDTQIIQEKKDINGKAIGSVLIGIVSILGIFLVGYGAIISVAGLLLGIFALREIKRLTQKGRKLAVFGMISNCIGIVSLFLN